MNTDGTEQKQTELTEISPVIASPKGMKIVVYK
jgi:hypothetical protein